MSRKNTTTNEKPKKLGEKRTTIAVSVPVRNALFARKEPSDSYDAVLRRELGLNE